jgi:hypothetical protein
MGFHGLNLWAVLVAAISAFVLGGLWYAPVLFGGAWKKANGFGADEPPPAGAKVFVISFVLSLVMAMGIGIVSLFEQRPWLYVLVNGGYLTVALVVMGAILGGWR